jgi:hypothetical protein
MREYESEEEKNIKRDDRSEEEQTHRKDCVVYMH